LSLSTKSLLLRLLEIILGGLFIYAGYLKLLRPEEFAEAVLAYQLVPFALVGAVTAVLPWLELAAGLFLALGLKRRSCLLLLASLTGVFLLVMFITLARGLKIDCGCGLFFTRQVGLVPIMEDGLLLLWAAGLYYGELKLMGQDPAPRVPGKAARH
jgi:putative oxidoreductase